MALILPLALAARGDTTIFLVASPIPPGTNFNFFVFVQTTLDEFGNPGTNYGPLASITEGEAALPFTQLIYSPGALEVDQFQLTIPDNVLSNSVTLTWTNFSTNIVVLSGPIFSGQLRDQSVFVGGTAAFDGRATHCAGYQWQRGGTNLVADGHFCDVTNSTLVISNAQMSDVGIYSVIAWHPLNPATNSVALRVYKPTVLTIGPGPGAGFTLGVANQDGSGFESNRLANVQIYSTTDLSLDFPEWNLETSAGTISNGVLWIDYPDDGSATKYWRLTEQ
jgi:hypothetical protein